MERVFHYTSMEAFLALLSSVEKSSDKKSFVFWATNIFFLNDPQEYTYGQTVLMKILKDIEYEKGIEHNIRLSALFSIYPEKSYDEWLEFIREDICKKGESPYVVSFSRNEDSIPMWLNYGNDGKGICMAFAEYRNKHSGDNLEPKNLSDIIVDIYDELGTHDVEYANDSNINNPLRRNFNYMYDYYLKKIKTIPSELLLELQLSMLRALTVIHAPYIKTNEFKGEREVRLSRTSNCNENGEPCDIKFKINAKKHIIPYIEVEIPTKQLDYVKISPLANKDLTIKAIDMVRMKFGLKFEIQESTIRYRDY